MMTFNLKLLQDFSLQEKAMHELAKLCWGNYSVPIEDYIRGPIKKEILSKSADSSHIKRHGEAVLSKVSEMFSSTMQNTLISKLKHAVICLQRGYREALACTEPYQYTHGLFMPNPLIAGPCPAKNFIDPSGRFDEVAWAKHFISNGNNSVYSRFELACFFAFEESLRDLWSSVKIHGSFRYLGDPFDIEKKYGYPVVIWIYQLENKFDELLKLGFVASGGFYCIGLRDAVVDRSHEHAARFFWYRCTESEKALFLNIHSNFVLVLMSYLACRRHSGMLYFVYSLLPLARKDRILCRAFSQIQSGYIRPSIRFYAKILSCLLLSSFYKTILSDILCTSLLLRLSDFSHILKYLSQEMVEIPLLEYDEIFLALWKHWNPNIDRFTPIIRNLLEIKAEGLLSKIIQPLRHDDKLSLLGDPGFWIECEYVWHGNYDLLLRFLLFFVIDLDPETQTFSLKEESIGHLCPTIETHLLKKTKERPASATLEIRKVVENIKESFEVLNYLLSRVEK